MIPFLLLQSLDLLTTLTFLGMGVAEANPIVSSALRFGITGLVVVKALCGAIGWWAWRRGHSLRVATWAYAGVVGWNLFIVGVREVGR